MVDDGATGTAGELLAVEVAAALTAALVEVGAASAVEGATLSTIETAM